MQDLLLEKQILNQRFCRGTPSSKSWNSAHVVQEVLSEVEEFALELDLKKTHTNLAKPQRCAPTGETSI